MFSNHNNLKKKKTNLGIFFMESLFVLASLSVHDLSVPSSLRVQVYAKCFIHQNWVCLFIFVLFLNQSEK